MEKNKNKKNRKEYPMSLINNNKLFGVFKMEGSLMRCRIFLIIIEGIKYPRPIRPIG